jgi:hypothetical protein
LDPTVNCSLKDADQIAQNYTGGCSRWKCQIRKVGIDMDNIQSYSFTKVDPRQRGGQGTYLRVQEGKLFDPLTGQYVRDTNRQDNVDIFERALFLTRDTKRFCDGNAVVGWAAACVDGDPVGARLGAVCGLNNPVEACNDCFTSANADKTCMQTDANIIFVRSRIYDLRGRRWVRMFSPTR